METLETSLANSYLKGFPHRDLAAFFETRRTTRDSLSPPAAPQAAHRSPLPTHPKASITPHPGGLPRKAGRSPSDRPFIVLGGRWMLSSIASRFTAVETAKAKAEKSVGASFCRLPAVLDTPKLSISKKKCSKIRHPNPQDMHFCK